MRMRMSMIAKKRMNGRLKMMIETETRMSTTATTATPTDRGSGISFGRSPRTPGRESCRFISSARTCAKPRAETPRNANGCWIRMKTSAA